MPLLGMADIPRLCWSAFREKATFTQPTWIRRVSQNQKNVWEEQGFTEDILTIRLQNFCTIDEIAKEVGGFDFILADLGYLPCRLTILREDFRLK